MFDAIVFLIFGLIFLVWSADRLVFGSAALARNFGISPLVIGMTILAMGSSAPEMMVSATAALDGKTDTAVGNVIGSNIANIALILGLTAMIKPLSVGSSILKREMPFLIIVTLVAGALLWDSYLNFYDGIILFTIFVIFIIGMLKISQNDKKLAHASSVHTSVSNESVSNMSTSVTPSTLATTDDSNIAQHAVSNTTMNIDVSSDIPEGVSNVKAGIWIVVGLIILPLSAHVLVDSATTIAKYFGMSDLVIGLTIIAIGTSLPELAASMAGALKGEDDMAVGNIIGSNIFNLLAVMGLPGLLNPSMISSYVMGRDFWVMLAVSLLLVCTAFGKTKIINRVEGFLLLLSFVLYQAYLLMNMAA